MKVRVYSELKLQELIGQMRLAFRKNSFLSVQYSDSKPRSLPQNAIGHTWYAQVARELGEDGEAAVKRFCKLHYGVPIMRADDEDFRAMYDEVIKPLPYEKKLKAMGLIPVTSLMNTDQLSRYLTDMRQGYQGRVALEFPEDPQAGAYA